MASRRYHLSTCLAGENAACTDWAGTTRNRRRRRLVSILHAHWASVVQEIVPVLHGLVGWQAVPARQESLQAVGFLQPVGQSVDDGVTQVPPEHVPWPVRMPPVQTGPGPHEIAGDDGWFPFSTHTGLPVVQEIVPVLHGLVGWQAVPARQESLQAVGFLQPVGQSVDDGVTQVPPEHVPWPVRMPPVQTGRHHTKSPGRRLVSILHAHWASRRAGNSPSPARLVGWQAVPARQESLQAVGFLQPVGQSVDDGVTQVPPEHVPWPVRMRLYRLAGTTQREITKEYRCQSNRSCIRRRQCCSRKPAAQFKLMHSCRTSS